MADKKISELNEKTDIVADDLLVIVDSEATPDETKKIKALNLGLKNIDSSLIVSFDAELDTPLTISGNFNVVPFHTLANYSLTDPGGNYDAGNDFYEVPFDGWYLIITKLRLADESQLTQFAQGAHTSNADNVDILWQETNIGTLANRDTLLNIRFGHFTAWNDPAGDRIRMIAYADDAVDGIKASMQIILLSKD